MAIDKAGAIYLSGGIAGEFDFGGGAIGPVGFPAGTVLPFLAKLTPDGGHVWSKTLCSTPGSLGAHELHVDAFGDLVILGHFFGDTCSIGEATLKGGESPGNPRYFMAKYSPLGDAFWARDIGGAYPAGAATDSLGRILLVGSFLDPPELGGEPLSYQGSLDGFLAAFDADGGSLWAQRFGDAKEQRARYAVVDSANHALVSGTFGGTIGLDGVLGGASYTQNGSHEYDQDTFLGKFDLELGD